MLSVSPSDAGCPNLTPASVAWFAELVRKTVTSPAAASGKRKSAARKKLKRVIREQQRYARTARLRAVALTLTYRDSKPFSPKHISAFLDRLRRALKRIGHILPYAWVLESASHLHYHLILWLPRGYVLDHAKLAKWWPWGSTWLEACRSVKAWGRYIAKFDSTAKLPKGARLYGYGGLDGVGKTAVSRVGLPRWLQALLPAGHRARRCAGGGWADLVTGEIHRSPYVWTPWGAVLRRYASPPVVSPRPLLDVVH
jgi:hypothetical protein